MEKFIITEADKEHLSYVPDIEKALMEAAKVKGTGLAKRSHEYLEDKIREGKAIIALTKNGDFMSLMNNLPDSDPVVAKLIREEIKRQEEGVELIPSENYTSRAVMQAMGSVFTNKYSEGYPAKRYYGGNEIVDIVENLAIERAKEIFKCEHVNVQPYSGSPANQAVYFALLELKDKFLGLNLTSGVVIGSGF